MFEDIKDSLLQALAEFKPISKLVKNDILVVGCSTSEVIGEKIGSSGSEEIADVIFETINSFCKQNGLYLAAQCCEHLNRAIIIEKEAYDYYRLTSRVNVMPIKHAGGSFATAAYKGFTNPVAVEDIQADAGLDIGDTLIGMHLKKVAVPVRVSVRKIGEANLILARTRAKFVGGERAVYNKDLL